MEASSSTTVIGPAENEAMDPRWQHSPNAAFLAGSPHLRDNSYDFSPAIYDQSSNTAFDLSELPCGTSDFENSTDVAEWSWSNYDPSYEPGPPPGAASSGDEYATQSITADNDKSDTSKKRREQNRRAQKAFRQRKQEEVEVLRDRLSETEERLGLLQNLHHELIDAYEDLLDRYQELQTQARRADLTPDALLDCQSSQVRGVPGDRRAHTSRTDRSQFQQVSDHLCAHEPFR